MNCLYAHMELLILIVLILICLTWLYTQTRGVQREGYMNYIGASDGLGSSPSPSTDGVGPELAMFGQGLPLADILVPRTPPGLTSVDAASCARMDPARQLELGGQYVQRTNNYRRLYPDSCSSLVTDFVGAIYEPGTMSASDVPCPGSC